jgi:hypothetical protein
MNLLFGFICLLLLAACNHIEKPEKATWKTIDFRVFTIQAPTSWVPVKQQGIDSYAGLIAIDEKDTLQFDFGSWSSNLVEEDPQFMERRHLEHFPAGTDTSQWIIVEKMMDVDLDEYRKNNVSWDTIDGYKAKIVYPRRSGIGTTGIYIDSISSYRGNANRFNLYGFHLSPSNEKKVLEAIKTLKFKR